jgi:hypothetical protein
MPVPRHAGCLTWHNTLSLNGLKDGNRVSYQPVNRELCEAGAQAQQSE